MMMADLDKDIDTVYVKDFSRLGRHNAKVLLLLDEFQERGKNISLSLMIITILLIPATTPLELKHGSMSVM